MWSKKRLFTIISIVVLFVIIILSYFGSYNYSSDQRRIIKQLGKPDSFTIIFDTEYEGKSDRTERWNYHDIYSSFEFVNGKFSSAEEIEDIPSDIIPVPYEPSQFQHYFTLKDVLDETGGNPSLKASDQIPELFEDMDVELYYSEQIAFAFDKDSGTLVYVSAIPLVSDEYAAKEESEEEDLAGGDE